jgi:hypothetical protein
VTKAPPDPRAQARLQAQRQALNALRKARRIADRAGVELSEWEGEFLGSVEARVKTYGRAFGDPEKGSPGMALSMLQSVKLKEITGKAKGEKKPMTRSAWRKSPPPSRDQSQED